MVIGLVLTLYPFQPTVPVKAHPCLSNKPVLGDRDDLMRVPPLQRQFSLPPRDDGRAFLQHAARQSCRKWWYMQSSKCEGVIAVLWVSSFKKLKHFARTL